MRFFEVNAALSEAHLKIYGTIGAMTLGELFGTESNPANASGLFDELRALDADTIHLHIYSRGGFFHDAVAMANQLRAHKARVIAHVEGLAASAATVLLAGADEVRMGEGSWLYIHNPWVAAQGDYRDFENAGEQLRALAMDMADLYAQASNEDAEWWAETMNAGTWMNAAQAVKTGLAHSIEPLALKAAALMQTDGLSGMPDEARTFIAELNTEVDMDTKIQDALAALGYEGEANGEDIATFLSALVPVADLDAARAALEEAQAKVSELETAQAQTDAALSEINERCANLSDEADEARKRAEAAEAKVNALAPGGFDAEPDGDGAGIAPDKTYFELVDELVDSGMEYEQAAIQVQREHKDAFLAMIRNANS
jgi:ATP-dependent protease ClpP protease subunit